MGLSSIPISFPLPKHGPQFSLHLIASLPSGFSFLSLRHAWTIFAAFSLYFGFTILCPLPVTLFFLILNFTFFPISSCAINLGFLFKVHFCPPIAVVIKVLLWNIFSPKFVFKLLSISSNIST